jgi:hypothetical protein
MWLQSVSPLAFRHDPSQHHRPTCSAQQSVHLSTRDTHPCNTILVTGHVSKDITTHVTPAQAIISTELKAVKRCSVQNQAPSKIKTARLVAWLIANIAELKVLLSNAVLR